MVGVDAPKEGCNTVLDRYCRSVRDAQANTETDMAHPFIKKITFTPATTPGYNGEAVDNAIASSNRSGRRIGGKEAKLIHALLKGRN